MRVPRSYLFVPGERPDRFAKAAASGADRVILDLEDAVGPARKDEARGHVVEWFGSGGQGIVRINGADTPWFEADLMALAQLPCAEVIEVMVPKADLDSLSCVAARLPGIRLLALVETVAGLVQLREAAGVPGVARLAFGNVDFGADARIPEGGAALDPVRFEFVIASRLADLPPPVDGVTVAVSDEVELQGDISRSRGMGFTGKLCIHPRQVNAVNSGYAPSKEEIDWARRMLSTLEKAGGSVVQIDGKMVDRPMIDRARQVLESAGTVMS